MKELRYLILIFLISLCACDENFLDRDPLDMMLADQVFSSPDAVDAYFVSLNRDLPIEDFMFANGAFNIGWITNENTFLANWTDESAMSNAFGGGNFDANWGNLYRAIRNVNAFIKEIDAVNISESKKTAYQAEAKFIRAFYYFGLVKYFGGVPILVENQVYSGGNTAELNLPRNKEAEVWDQIATDLDDAIDGLPAKSLYGRANKYVACALKSRAMLYAATIAKYGTVQLDGLVGIPASKANGYFQASYDASKKIIDDGLYSLYNGKTNKVENFQNLFLETSNPEVIFAKGYSYKATNTDSHSQDLFCLPYVVRGNPQGYGGSLAPTLQMVEEFEYVDGAAGKLKIADANGNAVHYADPLDLFTGKDPRFFASVIVPNTEFKNVKITVQRGVVKDGTKYIGTNVDQYFDLATKSFVAGNTGIVGTGNSGGPQALTSFHLKKYLDPTMAREAQYDRRSETDWIEFRLGEIILNHAEAAFELNKTGEALTEINKIRARAGISILSSVSLSQIRHERKVELAWENKYYWDLKRWARLDKDFVIWQPYRLNIWYDIDSHDYVFDKELRDGTKTYEQKHYYNQIPAGERNKNSLLVNNPGY